MNNIQISVHNSEHFLRVTLLELFSTFIKNPGRKCGGFGFVKKNNNES